MKGLYRTPVCVAVFAAICSLPAQAQMVRSASGGAERVSSTAQYEKAGQGATQETQADRFAGFPVIAEPGGARRQQASPQPPGSASMPPIQPGAVVSGGYPSRPGVTHPDPRGQRQAPPQQAQRPSVQTPAGMAQTTQVAQQPRAPVDQQAAQARATALAEQQRKMAAWDRAKVREFEGVPQPIKNQGPSPVHKLGNGPAVPVPSEPPVVPADISHPVPGSEVASRDPLASEVVRSGDSYFFNGSLNGTPVRYKINMATTGVHIPFPIARKAGILPPDVVSKMDTHGEVMAPVNSIVFGALPVRAVMAKIRNDNDGDQIEVGPDVLSNFKVQNSNGRRILVAAK